MNILFVAPYVPSPIRVRPYQIIRALARAGHRVTVAALEDGYADPAARRELESVCDAVHVVPHPAAPAALLCLLALPTPTPLWAAYARSPRMSRLLRDLAGGGGFDVAHVEHLRAAHFFPDLCGLPAVFDAVDCITALRRQMLDAPGGSPLGKLLSWEEWTKLRRYEPTAYRPFGRVAVTSLYDAAELRKLDPHGEMAKVVPNGVDVDYFAPDPAVVPEPDRIVFSGKMSYQANDDAARFLLESVVPRLLALRPGVRVTIAGSRPSEKLIQQAARMGGVAEVTGWVDDLRPHLRRASLAVVPLRIGVGIQNKVLEAMAVGRPVVCTPLAARALNAEATDGPEPPVRVAENDPDEIARACADLLARPETAARAGMAARRYVEAHHRWEKAADTFIGLYRAVSHP